MPSLSPVWGFSGQSFCFDPPAPPSPPSGLGATPPSPPPSAPSELNRSAKASVALCWIAVKDQCVSCGVLWFRMTKKLLTETHFVWITWSMVSLSSGLVLRQPLISSLASSDTSVQNGLGKSNWPSWILLFIPGDMGRPCWEEKGGNPHNLVVKVSFWFHWKDVNKLLLTKCKWWHRGTRCHKRGRTSWMPTLLELKRVGLNKGSNTKMWNHPPT